MKFIKCEECGKQVSEKASSCPECGFPISQLIKCEECGTSIPANSDLCPECGFPQALSSHKKPNDDAVREERERKEAAELLRATEEAEKKAASLMEERRRQAESYRKAAAEADRQAAAYRKAAQETSVFGEQEESRREKVVNGIKNPKNIVEGLGKIGGAEGIGEFDPKRFFGAVLKKYSEEEVIKTLTVGTPKTTPPINEISTEYPQPWLFFKLITPSIILFLGFIILLNQVPYNGAAFFGMILTGSFAIPISTLILFFEINIRKNVPIWTVVKIGLMGGIVSFFFTYILIEWTGMTATWTAGITEEVAKLIALFLLTRGKKKYPYILNGLLLGAAVGFGFEAFENAQYALSTGAKSFYVDIDAGAKAFESIQTRFWGSPIAHIVWTAVSGGALWRVQRGGNFYIGLFKKKEFYEPFNVMILCHVIWNSGILYYIPFFGGYLFIGLIAWILALSLVNLGIKQIADEKAGKQIFKTIK